MDTNQQPEILLLVGLPGSGKSTYLQNIKAVERNYVIISTDNLIEEEAKRQGKTYNDLWKLMIDEATKTAKAQFRQAVKERKNICYDQTNLTVGKRKSILSGLPKEYRKSAIVFTTPLEVIKERLVKRADETGKFIPLNVLTDMSNRLELPTISEGFDEVLFLV